MTSMKWINKLAIVCSSTMVPVVFSCVANGAHGCEYVTPELPPELAVLLLGLHLEANTYHIQQSVSHPPQAPLPQREEQCHDPESDIMVRSQDQQATKSVEVAKDISTM